MKIYFGAFTNELDESSETIHIAIMYTHGNRPFSTKCGRFYKHVAMECRSIDCLPAPFKACGNCVATNDSRYEVAV